MESKEIELLVRVMRRQQVSEFTYKKGDFELNVSFSGQAPLAAPVYAAAPAAPAAAPMSAPASAPALAAAPEKKIEYRVIKAPMVGIFYRAPAPDKPAFAKVGDRVQKGQVVCILSAMKLMNQIESEVDGVIAEILIENGQPVQFGQEMFRLTAA